ncbi:MAG: PQQ-binding-like beta-propeller repeat protein [Candidatus Bathyarchaeota archaeon]|nr:PQQ-binding-like beta-propeller repeat protein [Candidatus Bathyarchaeum tardum]
MKKTQTPHLRIVATLAAILLVSSFVLIPSFQVNAQSTENSVQNLLQYEWTQVSGNSDTARFSESPAPSTSDILWKANITNIHSYISAFNGMVFVSSDTTVFALDPETGETVWETQIEMKGTWPIVYKIDSAHMIVQGTCLNPQTGEILWTSSSFNADTGLYNNQVYSPEEKMFYIKNLSYIEAWNFSDPSKPPIFEWETYIPGSGIVGIGLTYGDGKIFPGSFQSMQFALDAKTGEILWSTRTKAPMIFSGSYSDGMFVRGGTDDNTMYCFNATTGEILWTYTPATNGYFTSGTAVGYGMVYEPNKDGNVYAINMETGELVWSYQGPGTMLFPGMATVADGKVYVTSGQDASFGQEIGKSEFVCLDAFTGEVIWSLPMEAFAPRESVIVAYGKLFVIPGDITTAIDSLSGNEYDNIDQIWAFGTSSSDSWGSWPMFRNDAKRSSIGNEGPSSLRIVWSYETEGAVISSPSIVNGIVYAGSQDMNIYAVDATNGELVWKYQTNGTIESSPAVVDGKLFIVSDDGFLYCLDAYQGYLIWKTYVNADLPVISGAAVMLRSSPAVVGKFVYVGSVDGTLYAVNTDNGNPAWTYETEGIIKSSPTVADGALYFTSEEPNEGALYKLDAKDGTLVWRKTLEYNRPYIGGSDMQGTPTVADGMVFVSSNVRDYYALDVNSGETIWSYSNPSAVEFIVSSPIYVDGKVYIIDKFDVACLNATTGEKLWRSYSGDELYVSPSYASGNIYLVTSQRHIFIIDAETSNKTLAYTTSAVSWSSPAVVDGKLYIGNNDWNIYCFAEDTTNNIEDTEVSFDAIVYTLIVVATVVMVVYAYFKAYKKQ